MEEEVILRFLSTLSALPKAAWSADPLLLQTDGRQLKTVSPVATGTPDQGGLHADKKEEGGELGERDPRHSPPGSHRTDESLASVAAERWFVHHGFGAQPHPQAEP